MTPAACKAVDGNVSCRQLKLYQAISDDVAEAARSAASLALLPVGIVCQVPDTACNIASRSFNAVDRLFPGRIGSRASALEPERESFPSIIAEYDHGGRRVRGAHDPGMAPVHRQSPTHAVL